MRGEASLTTSSTPITRRQEAARKAIHSAAAAVAACVVYLDPFGHGRAILAAAALTALTVELLRKTTPRFERSFHRAVGVMLRHREREGVTGASTLALGSLAAAWIAPPALAAAGILMAGLGDAAGAVVGRNLGRVRFPGGKSVEGSLACFGVACAAAALIPEVSLATALAGALVTTALEALSLRVDDNLYLPSITALTLRLVGTVAH